MSHTEFGYVPSLALFHRPAINTGIISHKWVQHRPISQVSNGLLEFLISGSSSDYVNLKASFIQVKGKIVKADGKVMDENHNVGFVNLPLQSLWSQVDLSLQQKVVNSRVSTNYAYKAYLDTLLHSTPKQQQNQLSSQLFVRDSATEKTDEFPTMGSLIRGDYTKDSQIVQMEGPLYLDLCQQDRLILNGVEIALKFWPNKSPFFIATDEKLEGYFFHIVDAYLNVCFVEISPAILVGHAAALKHSPALYPYYMSDLRTHSISKGSYTFSIDNLFQGDVPSEVIVGLVSAKAYSGAYEMNPFYFYHYNCNFCGFYINNRSVPSEPYKPNYSEKMIRIDLPTEGDDDDADGTGTNGAGEEGEEGEDKTKTKTNKMKTDNIIPVAYTQAYLSLFGEEYLSNDSIRITLKEYPFGYCLYKFKVSEIGDTNSDYITLPRRGHTSLHLTFKKPLEEDVNVIIYARFPRIIEIDESRNVNI